MTLKISGGSATRLPLNSVDNHERAKESNIGRTSGLVTDDERDLEERTVSVTFL